MSSVVKPRLTLIHGWGCDSHIWETLMPYLSPYFETALLDLPGHGDSNLSSAEWKRQDWLETYARSVPENTLLCGWSLGGMIAMQLAVHCPEKVTRLITISATPKFSASKDWPLGVSKESLDEMQRVLEKSPKKLLKLFQGWMSKGEADTKKVLQRLRKNMAWKDAPTYLETLKVSLEHLIDKDIRSMVSQIEKPWLALQGANDILVTANALQAYSNVEQVEIADAGHAPMVGHATVLAEHLINFGCEKH